MLKVIEVILIVGAFAKSFWLGLFTLGYIVYIEEEYKDIKDKLTACLNEIKLKRMTQTRAKRTPDKIHPYKGCVIEEYGGSIFQIMNASGEALENVFLSIEEAKKEIDSAHVEEL